MTSKPNDAGVRPTDTDPAILSNAIRALKLDIDAELGRNEETPTSQKRRTSQGDDLISPTTFEAPTPLSSPIAPLTTSGKLFGGIQSLSSTRTTESPADKLTSWRFSSPDTSDRSNTLDEATDGKKTGVGRTHQTAGSLSFEQTPPATPRANVHHASPGSLLDSVGSKLSSLSPLVQMSSGSNAIGASSSVTSSPVAAITPAVRVSRAGGDALEIATRLQQQQQAAAAAAGAASASLATPFSGSQLLSPQRSEGLASTAGTMAMGEIDQSHSLSTSPGGFQQQLQQLGGVAVSGGTAFAMPPAAVGLSGSTAAMLGSAFPSPAGGAAALNIGRSILADPLSGSDTSIFSTPTQMGSVHAPSTPVNMMSPDASFDMSFSPGLDPTAMLFQNEHTANVYVNALPLTTTDDDLWRIGSAFGTVLSHKAIIAAETGLCKGYGFLLYSSRDEAERAVGLLGRMGLQASFAKESFSARLRRMADKSSANVYLSNLPTDMTTHQLEHLFAPHNVISMRILLNSDGTSRGVGFVRLRDRDIAQDCIDRLHGKVRFADSEGQKLLKRNAMMQNSINALNAQARDVLRSSSASILGSEMGMPSPSASPHVPFPLPTPTTTTSAAGGMGAGAGLSPVSLAGSHAYMPYPPSTIGGAMSMGGSSIGASLPTPGPSPGDAQLAATAMANMMAATSSPMGYAGANCPVVGGTFGLPTAPLQVNVHAADTQMMLTTTAMTTPGQMTPDVLAHLGLASPIPKALGGAGGAPGSRSTLAVPSPGGSSGFDAMTNIGLVPFSPPMLNIQLGNSPSPGGGMAARDFPAAMTSRGGIGGEGVTVSSGLMPPASATAGGVNVTAPYSSYQLQHMLGSSLPTSSPGSGRTPLATSPQPTGLVSAYAGSDS
ncbi:hypothetical protein OC861_002746 [Tilletia horrida]|nr:hypothetical protein OC861_002746 [Tilletia horrida]